MEVLLQYWDECDDLWHAARFRFFGDQSVWLPVAAGILLLGIGTPLAG